MTLIKVLFKGLPFTILRMSYGWLPLQTCVAFSSLHSLNDLLPLVAKGVDLFDSFNLANQYFCFAHVAIACACYGHLKPHAQHDFMVMSVLNRSCYRVGRDAARVFSGSPCGKHADSSTQGKCRLRLRHRDDLVGVIVLGLECDLLSAVIAFRYSVHLARF